MKAHTIDLALDFTIANLLTVFLAILTIDNVATDFLEVYYEFYVFVSEYIMIVNSCHYK